MENKVVSTIVIIGLLMLGLGMLQRARALGCSPSQLQCIEVCDDEDIPHEQCVKECGCSELNLLLHSKPAGRKKEHPVDISQFAVQFIAFNTLW
jgi:hypothetical protein